MVAFSTLPLSGNFNHFKQSLNEQMDKKVWKIKSENINRTMKQEAGAI